MKIDEPRAPVGGELVRGRAYRAGEFEPFYVPRPCMPQVNLEDYQALLQFATRRGVRWSSVSLDPTVVRPHQRVDHELARKMDACVLAKPILVSVEPFILDGHHRWWEHNALQRPVEAYRFELSFGKALDLLFAFPGTWTITPGAPIKD